MADLEYEKMKKDFTELSWEMLLEKMGEEMNEAALIMKLREKFEKHFRYDSQGLPRLWSVGDNIDKEYMKAREETEILLEMIGRMDFDLALTSSKDPFISDYVKKKFLEKGESWSILNSQRLSIVDSQIKKEMEVSYIEAKRSMMSTTNKIPLWLIVVLLVLGWNEFIAILSNPLYMMLLVFAAVLAYLIVVLRLTPVLKLMARKALNGVSQ